jgi:hypothetical protein
MNAQCSSEAGPLATKEQDPPAPAEHAPCTKPLQTNGGGPQNTVKSTLMVTPAGTLIVHHPGHVAPGGVIRTSRAALPPSELIVTGYCGGGVGVGVGVGAGVGLGAGEAGGAGVADGGLPGAGVAAGSTSIDRVQNASSVAVLTRTVASNVPADTYVCAGLGLLEPSPSPNDHS